MTPTMLTSELAAVRGELARVDSKCSILAGLAGAGMLALIGQLAARQAPRDPAWWVGCAAALLLAAAVVVLLWVLRPRLGKTGFRAYATMTAAQITSRLGDGDVPSASQAAHEAGELRVLSQIVNRKFVALRRAVDLCAAAVVLIGAALLVGVIA